MAASVGRFQLALSLCAFALRGGWGNCGLRRFLLCGTDGVEALLQRVHQVDDPGWRLDCRRDNLFPGDLGFDDQRRKQQPEADDLTSLRRSRALSSRSEITVMSSAR